MKLNELYKKKNFKIGLSRFSFAFSFRVARRFLSMSNYEVRAFIFNSIQFQFQLVPSFLQFQFRFHSRSCYYYLNWKEFNLIINWSNLANFGLWNRSFWIDFEMDFKWIGNMNEWFPMLITQKSNIFKV